MNLCALLEHIEITRLKKKEKKTHVEIAFASVSDKSEFEIEVQLRCALLFFFYLCTQNPSSLCHRKTDFSCIWLDTLWIRKQKNKDTKNSFQIRIKNTYKSNLKWVLLQCFMQQTNQNKKKQSIFFSLYDQLKTNQNPTYILYPITYTTNISCALFITNIFSNQFETIWSENEWQQNISHR